ncbi:unnamed protein product [Arabis nemorensis]|uniref:Uncharacterized protein n=1 Tax=Arabis nemorensis TaxID=586526 RepID=A0A565CRK2_9BRAS|nr:unnamed protein product [Arabis nemorensis]
MRPRLAVNLSSLYASKDNEWTPQELDQTAEAIGYGAVKYAVLKNKISKDYTFNADQMLNDKFTETILDLKITM